MPTTYHFVKTCQHSKKKTCQNNSFICAKTENIPVTQTEILTQKVFQQFKHSSGLTCKPAALAVTQGTLHVCTKIVRDLGASTVRGKTTTFEEKTSNVARTSQAAFQVLYKSTLPAEIMT